MQVMMAVGTVCNAIFGNRRAHRLLPETHRGHWIMTRYNDKSDHPEATELNQDAYSSACACYEQQDYDRAKVLFEKALEYRSEDPQAWFALGNCHDAMSQPSRAEVCYLMSLKFSSPDAQPSVYFNLGNSLFDQGKYQEAVNCYSRIDDQSRVYPAAQKNLRLAVAADQRNSQ
jgi:tetratricopeptide (TPR) repeat protein